MFDGDHLSLMRPGANPFILEMVYPPCVASRVWKPISAWPT
jgi:hypothetical protein